MDFIVIISKRKMNTVVNFETKESINDITVQQMLCELRFAFFMDWSFIILIWLACVCNSWILETYSCKNKD